MKKVMVTCYDASFAKLIRNSGAVDYVLVGDSMGMVIYGRPNTRHVSERQMIEHVEAVALGLSGSSVELVADFVFGSDEDPLHAVQLARQFQKAGAQWVKIEGPKLETVRALRTAGLKICGHIGLTPQSILEYRLQGKTSEDQARLLQEAKDLEEAGAEMLVLELIPSDLARTITESLKILTIGIGAGPHTGGQVLVLYDLLGLNPDFQPRFLKTYAPGAEIVTQALKSYAAEVRESRFPSSDQSFS